MMELNFWFSGQFDWHKSFDSFMEKINIFIFQWEQIILFYSFIIIFFSSFSLSSHWKYKLLSGCWSCKFHEKRNALSFLFMHACNYLFSRSFIFLTLRLGMLWWQIAFKWQQSMELVILFYSWANWRWAWFVDWSVFCCCAIAKISISTWFRAFSLDSLHSLSPILSSLCLRWRVKYMLNSNQFFHSFHLDLMVLKMKLIHFRWWLIRSSCVYVRIVL